MRRRAHALVGSAIVASCGVAIAMQRTDVFLGSRDDAAIGYSTAALTNAATALNDELRSGRRQLTFDPGNGYLRSLLDALSIPVESQLLVYSQTSFQARRISRANPRAVYFNERSAVGFVRGGDILEVAVQDLRQGTVFYALTQSQTDTPVLTRENHCLSCHLSWETRGVPGTIVMSVFPRRSDNEYASGSTIDHRSTIDERWGGWYVTGARVPRSMGNMELLQPDLPPTGPKPVPARTSVEGAFDARGYPTMFSDVVALMVLEHQAQAQNLITRAGWEYRTQSKNSEIAIEELVDYLLFVDEAPLPHPIKGSSGFAEKFAASGPHDAKGRSLRELDLSTRMMKYPLSYMIYSPGFAGLPDDVKRTIRSRLDDVLAGKDTRKKYAHLTAPARVAIQEILRDTVPGLKPGPTGR